MEQGLTPAEIKRLVRGGDLIRLRRGCYALRGSVKTPEQRHRHLLEATRPTLAPDAVFTHVTAAVVHGLPVPIPSLARIHITRVDGGGRVTANVCRHSASLPDWSLTEVDGLLVTTIERTVVDVTRWLSFEHGVAVVDAALRRGVERASLEEELVAARRRRFNTRARRAVAFGDPRAESPVNHDHGCSSLTLGCLCPTFSASFATTSVMSTLVLTSTGRSSGCVASLMAR